MRIGILGIGAIGGLIAALLHRNGQNITCICRKETQERINQYGLKLESKIYGDYSFKPTTTTFLNEDLDLLLIATKTQYLSMALKQVNPENLRNSIVVPLLNGVGFMDLLESTFHHNVIYGTIGALEVVKEENTISHKSTLNRPIVELGSMNADLSCKIKEITSLLKKIDFNASFLQQERDVIWNKLIRLNTVSSFTAAYQKSIGQIRSDSALKLQMELFTKETIKVANLDGYNIKPEKVMAQIDQLPFELRTSLQRDIAAQKSSELDFITGGVLRLGIQKNISMPIHAQIYNQISRY